MLVTFTGLTCEFPIVISFAKTNLFKNVKTLGK